MIKRSVGVFGALVLMATLVPAAATTAATGDLVLINEVLASHAGTDDTEFVELYGTPGTSLAGLSLIVVEGDAFGPGAIDRRFDFKAFHEIGANGFFLFGNCSGLVGNYSATPDASLFNNYLENSSLTVALAETASLSSSNVTGSEVVLDALALTDGDVGDTFYFGASVIGPDGSFFPAGARRLADGVDTDAVADWTISSFNLPGDNTPTGGGFDGCAPIELTISEIQGDGQFSDYAGEVVTTTGVVTAVSANGRDMWIQDPAGDGDPATSDGVFVDDRNTLSNPPVVGDHVRVTGTVDELQFGSGLPLTQINNPDSASFAILSSGNPLPGPVSLVDLPDRSLADGIAFFEALEGMRVSITNAPVVAPTSSFGEFGALTKNDAKPGSGYQPSNGQILLRSVGANAVDYNPERILVDDSTLDEAIHVRPGDRVRSLTGVMDYTFGMFKIQPTEYDILSHMIPKGRVSMLPNADGDLRVATFNVENLFDLADNPDKDDEGSTPDEDELETKLAKLALAFENELLLPDIVVVQEVENTAVLVGDSSGFVPGGTVEPLLARLPGGLDRWSAVSFETSDGRGIEVAFVWDTESVGLMEAFQLSGADVAAAFGPSSASPGREPLVGMFEVGEDVITIVGNHFKSKGGDDPPFGVNDPFIRITEGQRKLQAGAVAEFVSEILDDDPNANVIVAGDLNDFEFGEPGEGTDHTLAILEEAGLTNLVLEVDAKDRFSYIFDGNSQVLDHFLVSAALLPEVHRVDILHINASFPAALGADPTTAIRSSDHDPIHVRFGIEAGIGEGGAAESIRFATFNASLNRFNAGDLVGDLSSPDSVQAQNVAETIQRVRPDVVLINEFDWDADGEAAEMFQDGYLSVSQNGAAPITYPHRYVAPSNTGVPSGFDLNNDGTVGGPDDAFGFGFFEGQYAFVVYSRYPIESDDIRTFQQFLWQDMPGNLIPAGFYGEDELDVLRLSSKNHVDVPIEIGGETVHFLVSHPTPPVFDGPEDRNGRRNYDEIRFWADYVTGGSTAAYIYDDGGTWGGLDPGSRFVIAGDQNADPFDGDSVAGAAQLLLDHPLVDASVTPSSLGGPEQAALQGSVNLLHEGRAAYDTADFSEASGNLRVDYVLPSLDLGILDAGVFWPLESDQLFRLVGIFPFPTSDHRLVWVDLALD